MSNVLYEIKPDGSGWILTLTIGGDIMTMGKFTSLKDAEDEKSNRESDVSKGIIPVLYPDDPTPEWKNGYLLGFETADENTKCLVVGQFRAGWIVGRHDGQHGYTNRFAGS